MIVVATGMPKSGTGWWFNVHNDLLVAEGHSDVRALRGATLVKTDLRASRSLRRALLGLALPADAIGAVLQRRQLERGGPDGWDHLHFNVGEIGRHRVAMPAREQTLSTPASGRSWFPDGLRAVSGERVSVVVTSYNQKAYLVEAIESVLAQTRPAHELIVVDDASADGSQELIRAYEARHPGRVIGLLQERNCGIPKTRTAGLKRCTGELLGVLDGDDRLLPGFVESQTRRLGQMRDAGCVYGNLFFVDAEGRRIRIRDERVQPEGEVLLHVAAGAMGLPRSLLVRKAHLQDVGFLDERFPKFDGFVLTLRLARMTRFAYVAEPTADTGSSAGGDSRTIRAEEMVTLEAVWAEVQRACAGLPGPPSPRFARRGPNACSSGEWNPTSPAGVGFGPSCGFASPQRAIPPCSGLRRKWFELATFRRRPSRLRAEARIEGVEETRVHTSVDLAREATSPRRPPPRGRAASEWMDGRSRPPRS